MNYINKLIICSVLLLILGVIYWKVYLSPPTEGLTNSLDDWYNPKSSSKQQLNKEQISIPDGISSINSDICEFPCDGFSGLNNSWENKNINKISRDKDKNKNKLNSTQKVLLNPNKFFNYNISSPDCCSYNSNYSTSNGCLCITPEQYKFLNSRGGNRFNASY